MTDPDLLPCPHCGGAAKSFHRPDDTGWSNTDWICCENEDCGAGTCLHESRDIAVHCWNRRTVAPQQSGEWLEKTLLAVSIIMLSGLITPAIYLAATGQWRHVFPFSEFAG